MTYIFESTVSEIEEIQTQDQGIQYAQHQIAKVEQGRLDVDLCRIATEQRKLFQTLLIRYGAALATLATLRVCRKLPDDAYRQMRADVMGMLGPRVIQPERA
jgi:hypothetical protein